MKKIMLLCSLLLLTLSCTTDSVENTNQVVIGYKYTIENLYNDPAVADFTRVIIGNLSNGKFFSETSETFLNGVSQGSPTTEQLFFYSSNRLYLRKSQSIGVLDIYYYYDVTGNLIGATGAVMGTPELGPNAIFERYVYQPNNMVFCERINTPYNDPNPTVTTRHIIQTNALGEIIAAGRDNNLDGIPDYLFTYTYNDGDLTSMQRPDGTIENFSYSGVIDTYSHLQELSCGKQALQFPNAGMYSGGGVSLHMLSLLKLSKHITSDYLLLENYQLLPSSFYFKRNSSVVMNLPTQGTRTEEMEYFFN